MVESVHQHFQGSFIGYIKEKQYIFKFEEQLIKCNSILNVATLDLGMTISVYHSNLSWNNVSTIEYHTAQECQKER